MQILLLSLLLFSFTSSFSSEIIRQVKRNIESSLQETFPAWCLERYYGANVSIECLERAVEGTRNSFFELALEKKKSKGITVAETSCLLRAAVKGGNAWGVQKLLQEGANVNQPDENGQTSLHIALKHENSYLAGIILAEHPNLDVVDHYGNSIFVLARQRYQSPEEFGLFVQYLLHNHKVQLKEAIGTTLKDEKVSLFTQSFLVEAAKKDEKFGCLAVVSALKVSNRGHLNDLSWQVPVDQRAKIAKQLSSEHAKKLLKNYPEIYKCFFKTLPLKDIVHDPDYLDAIKRNYLFYEWNQNDEKGNNVLMLAAQANAPTFADLISLDFDLQQKNEDDDSVLSLATKANNKSAVQHLLSKKYEALEVCDKKASEALVHASDSVRDSFENKWHHIFSTYERIGRVLQEMRSVHKKIRNLKTNEVNVCRLKKVFLETYQHMIDDPKGSCDAIVPFLHLIISEKDLPDENSIAFFNLILNGYMQNSDASSLENLAWVEDIVQTYLAQDNALLDRLTQEVSCSICNDEFDKKKSVTVCANNHRVCLECYNRPQLNTCPMCRADLPVDKLKICQNGCLDSKKLRWHFCAACNHSVIVCERCLELPCCGSTQSYNQFLDLLKWTEYMQKYQEYYTEKTVRKLQNYEITTLKEMKEKVDYIDSKLNSLDARIKELANKIKTPAIRSASYTVYGPNLGKLIMAHNQLADEANKLINERNSLVLGCSKKLEDEKKRVEAQLLEQRQKLMSLLQF